MINFVPSIEMMIFIQEQKYKNQIMLKGQTEAEI